jgi:hypothetical protein
MPDHPTTVHALDSLQQIDRTKDIDSWSIRLYFLSRHPGLLALVSLSVVLIGLGVAWLIQKPFLASVGLDFKPGQLEAELAKPKPDLAAVVKMLPKAAHFYFEDTPAKDWIDRSQLAETEKLVAKAIWDSFAESDGFEPGADLLYYAHYIRPIRYANELIGDYYFL